MSPAKKPSRTLQARGPRQIPEAVHTCMRCPACATEACKVLQDLGMYCETSCAASQAIEPAKAQRNAA